MISGEILLVEIFFWIGVGLVVSDNSSRLILGEILLVEIFFWIGVGIVVSDNSSRLILGEMLLLGGGGRDGTMTAVGVTVVRIAGGEIIFAVGATLPRLEGGEGLVLSMAVMLILLEVVFWAFFCACLKVNAL